MTKLLFSDIDGTLLRKDGTISPTLARKLREMGQAAKRFTDADTDRLIWEDIAALTGGKQQKQDRG